MADLLLQVQGVSKTFELGRALWARRWLRALDQIDLEIERGQTLGIVGETGSGKSTVCRVILGLIRPTAGRVIFDGVDVTGWPAHRMTVRGLVRTFQIARGFPRLSVLENLVLYGARQPGETLWRAVARPPSVARRERELRDRAFDVAERLNLTPLLDMPASDLSGGQKKLLELGRALMTEPRLIMLDEPQSLPETHGFITSGWNAVPTGGKVIARIAPLLGIEPRFDLPPSDRLILAASKTTQ